MEYMNFIFFPCAMRKSSFQRCLFEFKIKAMKEKYRLYLFYLSYDSFVCYLSKNFVDDGLKEVLLISFTRPCIAYDKCDKDKKSTNIVYIPTRTPPSTSHFLSELPSLSH